MSVFQRSLLLLVAVIACCAVWVSVSIALREDSRPVVGQPNGVAWSDEVSAKSEAWNTRPDTDWSLAP